MDYVGRTERKFTVRGKPVRAGTMLGTMSGEDTDGTRL